MSSILTNNSAMVALQNLKSINMDLSKTQNEISTGKSISSASDNASMWAISKVMEADVAGFSAISKSLALGESTVAVAAAGAEKIVDILKEIKGKVVAATGANVDHFPGATMMPPRRDHFFTLNDYRRKILTHHFIHPNYPPPAKLTQRP